MSIQSCSSGQQTQIAQPGGELETKNSGDAQVVAAQNYHGIKVEVTVAAEVVRLLADDDRGLPHQKFLIGLSNGTTVLIAHNTRAAPRVPLRLGDTVKIHGEYIWNAKGGLIHWTHHSDNPAHESGWIEHDGTRYQ